MAIIILIIFVVGVGIIIALLNVLFNNSKSAKGYKHFANGYCEYEGQHEFICTIAPTGKCTICNEVQLYNGDELCYECAKETRRCERCGKLIK